MDYQVVHTIPERLRIRIPLLATDSEYASKLQRRVESLQGVTSVRINPAAASIVVTYKAKKMSQDTLLAVLHTAIEELAPPPEPPEAAPVADKTAAEPPAPTPSEPAPPIRNQPAAPGGSSLADPWDDPLPVSPEVPPEVPLPVAAEMPPEVSPAQQPEATVASADQDIAAGAAPVLEAAHEVIQPAPPDPTAAETALSEEKPASKRAKAGKTAAAQRRSTRSTSPEKSRKRK